IVLAAPKEIWSVGTVLTFAAVLAIAFFSEPIRRILPHRPAFLFSSLAPALAAQAGPAPIPLWRFNTLAAGGRLTRRFCLPVAPALIGRGALMLAGLSVGVFLSPVAWLFGVGSRTLEFLAERAAGVAYLRPTPPLRLVILVMIALLASALLFRRARPVAAGAAVLLLLLLALRPGPPGPQRGFSLESPAIPQRGALLVRCQRHPVRMGGGGPIDLG